MSAEHMWGGYYLPEPGGGIPIDMTQVSQSSGHDPR